jgi:Uma2 family endonuclease
MSTVALKSPSMPATEAELLALPEQGRGYELIGGELVEKQTGFRHGRAQFNLAGLLSPYRRSGGGADRPGGWWFLTEQLVSFSPSQVLRPDVAGWLRERLSEPPEDEETVVRVRPDWVCEIISPRKAANDLIRKKRIYHQHQVPCYWIVDPRDESLTVLQWTAKGYLEILAAQRGERVRAEPFLALDLQVGVLFGEDEDEPPPAVANE